MVIRRQRKKEREIAKYTIKKRADEARHQRDGGKLNINRTGARKGSGNRKATKRKRNCKVQDKEKSR